MASAPPGRPSHPREPSPSALTIRNIVVAGHRTSVRLEPLMWEALRDIARLQGVGLNDLVTEIDRRRQASSLTAAIRVYIVGFYRSAAGPGLRAEPATVVPLPM
jgi:predicted DNA-binding ribbon-helix-helix protein